MDRLNFFLIGAAKSGTTTLYERMKDHPEIYLSPLKEPNYWSSDIDPDGFSAAFKANTPLDLAPYFSQHPLPELQVGFVRSAADYARLFDGVRDEEVIGECSTSYLFSENAAKEVAAQYPDAKILVVLRDPVERLFSHYLMARKYGYTTLELRDAIEKDRAAQDKGWGKSELFVELGMYGEQLGRWVKHFPKEQIKVLFTPELDQEDCFDGLWNWLGVMEHRAEGTQEKENQAGLARFEGLNKWLTDSGFKRVLGAFIPPNFKRKLLDFYYTDVNLPTLSAEDRKYLAAFYAEDRERLENLLDRPVPWN